MNEKEFEKQQLEQLLNDLKDIDKYTSFKNGAFIYDLGKYQGSLLINHINNLQSKIHKANEIIKDWHQEYNGLMETNNIYIPKDKPNLFDLRDVLEEDI